MGDEAADGLGLPRRRFDDSEESLDRRVTRLEVTVTGLASTIDRELKASGHLHDSIAALIAKLDGNLDSFKDQLTIEREARTAADTHEREARLALATDLRVFTARILVGIGILVFIAQFGATLFGPIIRAAVGLPQ
jgi:hypothetical protein